MARRIRIAAFTGAALLAVSNPQIAAWAAGGGGGGGGAMPSDNTPQYDAAAEYRSGIAALEQQRWKDAERAFARVLAMAPRDPNTNFLMALSKLGRNDFKAARGFLEKAIKYDPNLLAAHVKLGVAQAKLDDPAKAQAELDWLNARASACANTCADAVKITQGIAEVTSAMAAGIQARLNRPDLHAYAAAAPGDRAYLAAIALINEHRYEAAIAELELAQMRFGPHPDVLTYMGFANRKLQRFDHAEHYYRAALAIAPDHLGAIEYYGEMMLERGDRAGAQNMLARLDALCTFGCAQSDELRRWIALGSSQG